MSIYPTVSGAKLRNLLFLFTAIFGMSMGAQNVAGPASIAVPHLVIKNATVTDILASLSQQYRVPIGIVDLFVGSDDNMLSINVDNGTLGDAFRQITKQEPRLSWSTNPDGAVRFHDKERGFDIADITISSLNISNVKRVELAGALNDIQDVKIWLASHSCSLDEMIAGRPATNSSLISLNLKTTTLGGVLDALALQSGTYFWMLREYSSKPCRINIGGLRLAVSLR